MKWCVTLSQAARIARQGGASRCRKPRGRHLTEHDAATGLADFHARPYRADLAIFLAPDPLPLFNPERVLETPSRLYSYAYASGDPINRSDPSGLTPREWASGFWDDAKQAAAEVAHGVAELARSETRAVLDGRNGDYVQTNLAVTLAQVKAPVELAKNVAHFGDDFAASVFTASDYEAGRKAFKPVSTAMAVTAVVLGARVGPGSGTRPPSSAASSVTKAVTSGDQVTEQVIRDAMKGAPLASQQSGAYPCQWYSDTSTSCLPESKHLLSRWTDR